MIWILDERREESHMSRRRRSIPGGGTRKTNSKYFTVSIVNGLKYPLSATPKMSGIRFPTSTETAKIVSRLRRPNPPSLLRIYMHTRSNGYKSSPFNRADGSSLFPHSLSISSSLHWFTTSAIRLEIHQALQDRPRWPKDPLWSSHELG